MTRNFFRTLIVKFVPLGMAVVLTFVGCGEKPQGGSATFPKWTELPAIEVSDDRVFCVHYAEMDRNYSMLYDKSTYSACWVAYPLHACYTMKSGERADAWGYDPVIPKEYQTPARRGYGDYDILHYDRGHQIPSADRLAGKQMNEQTFYYTNITPQKANLNQRTWKSLEDHLRRHAEALGDTIWVVTGAVFRTIGGNEEIRYIKSANDGRLIPVPNYYYKVALKKMGGGYTSAGFWMENRDDYLAGDSLGEYFRSVREIEKLTGFDFFTNLPLALQEATEPVDNRGDWGIAPAVITD